MNYQQLFLPWFGNQSGGETVKPWGTWLVESDRKLRDGTGWWRNLSVRRVWLLPRVVERFSVMVLYKVEYDQIDPESFSLLLWVLWLMNFTVDHHMTKTRWSKRHWLWTTRSSWTLDLASSNPRHLKGSGWKESQSSKSSSSRFILGRKKWDPPNPSWILEEQSVQTRYLGPRTQPSLRKPRGYQLEVRAKEAPLGFYPFVTKQSPKALPQGCFVFDLQVGASMTWLAHVCCFFFFFFSFFQSSPCNPFFPTFSWHNDTIMIAIPTDKF